MKQIILLLTLFALFSSALSEEITGEVDLTMIDPYEKIASGFCLSYRPEILEWKGLSLGGGMGLYITSRFKFQTSDYILMEDSLDWYEFREDYLDIINLDMFLEGRWQLLGLADESHWKAWITISGGLIIHSSVKTTDLTEIWADTTTGYFYPMTENRIRYTTQQRTEPYFSPGLLIGIGNFVVGYRHWIYADDYAVKPGKPGRTIGMIRIGYRFIW